MGMDARKMLHSKPLCRGVFAFHTIADISGRCHLEIAGLPPLGFQPMRRVLIMLDVTEVEAEHVVEALVPVSPHFQGVGVKQAFDEVRSAAPQEARGMLLQIRSRASGELGGPDTGIAYQEVG